MKRRFWTKGILLLAGLALATGTAAAETGPASSGGASAGAALSSQVRKEILGLPYYGVFDLLAYKVGENGVVTLGGYARWGLLKTDGERAVKGIRGVTRLEDRIEVLPTSTTDEDLRWAVYRAIYRDPALVRYGTPENALPRVHTWGRGFQGRGLFWREPPFLAMEPVGTCAIHIIVKNGRVILAGEVDSEKDRGFAKLAAGSVPGVFSVDDELLVAGTTTAQEP